MAALNRCEFIGNLGADPEIRRLNSGDPVVNLRLAVSETWRDRNSGERKERTDWIPVVIFNEQIAKVAEQYLKKGSKVFVAGSWQSRKWTDQTGNERYTTECVLQKFRGELVMLDSRQSDARQSSGYGEGQSGYGSGPSDLGDEDLPF